MIRPKFRNLTRGAPTVNGMTLGGFSAHAGQTDLLHWFDAVAGSRPRMALIHGEERGRDTLARLIRKRYDLDVQTPIQGDVIRL